MKVKRFSFLGLNWKSSKGQDPHQLKSRINKFDISKFKSGMGVWVADINGGDPIMARDVISIITDRDDHADALILRSVSQWIHFYI